MRTLIAVAIIASLAGCTTYDRARASNFEPLPDGKFRFQADKLYPYTDQDLIGWLETSLKENNYCPSGYEITDKKEVVRAETMLGTAKSQIFYGRCK
ncbi:hypothetical protein [uncultured Thalassospira sp.]|uniref:hypothetical protein n=1 Tax=uncultured Thalassospira sp. TaxID=404382 RepID=UPI0030DD0103|tara:strand:- start:31015 stop:31305 length:291 start_codon:yes stop_codon:yes gene_type:complete